MQSSAGAVQRRAGAQYFLFRDNLGAETLDEGGYFAMTALDAATEMRNETIRRSSRWASASSTTITRSRRRSTIDMRYASALDMADHTITYRLIVK